MTGLLIFALAYLFVTPAPGDFVFGELVGRLFFSLIILAGVLTTFTPRWGRALAMFEALAGNSTWSSPWPGWCLWRFWAKG
jgi:hypothetical protein